MTLPTEGPIMSCRYCGFRPSGPLVESFGNYMITQEISSSELEPTEEGHQVLMGWIICVQRGELLLQSRKVASVMSAKV